ncbi:DUF6503 family protein [Leeuwenhoekiella sp. NPDC079379]|uniref:DUF6503 family protein n=1 Tax=Leeuwenhoekiella sp. NPDC079379 TaxID=3364122 RepID=UPI0037C59F67
MKYTALALLFIICLSCNSKKEQQPVTITQAIVEETTNYPEILLKILNAHGGLDTWKTYQTLTFTIDKAPNTDEVHTIDLHSRKDHIDMGTVSMGYDGNKAWLRDPEQTYKGNADFYHNLMFYFYAMPFVLADQGIIYEQTEDLVVNDTSYLGLKINFEAQIGSSSNDEYYLYYDLETYQMRWLGYTATFGAAEKSDAVNFIAYDNWTLVEHIRLPKSISWYTSENGKLTEPRNTVDFKEIRLSTEARPEAFYTNK